MKKIKTNVLSLALALIMLVAGIIPFGTVSVFNASAYDEKEKLYYFSDSDPLLDEEVMEYNFPGYEVDYDLFNNFDEGTFNNLIAVRYLEGALDYCGEVAIIQITTFKLAPEQLQRLLFQLNTDKIILISNYDDIELLHTDFYTDLYRHLTVKSPFYKYVERSVRNMYDRGFELDELTILIDNRFIDFSVLNDKDMWYDDNLWLEEDGWVDCKDWFFTQNRYLTRLCYYSEYLRALLQQLCIRFLHNGTDIYDYTSIVRQLKDANVRLMVDWGVLGFISLLDAIEFEFDEYDQGPYYEDLDSMDRLNLWNSDSAAMGEWELEQYFYDELLDVQDDLEIYHDIQFPVYIYEVDPIEYSPDDEDALKIISDTSLREYYLDVELDEEPDEAEQFLQLLKGCLN